MSDYAALTLAIPALETFIERVPARDLNVCIDVWKGMRKRGWDVTALVAPDGRTVVALGCRGGETREQLNARRDPDCVLMAVRDAIAERGGLEVSFPGPLPEHSLRLMRTLGVTVREPAA